jgi:hypothetical protein
MSTPSSMNQALYTIDGQPRESATNIKCMQILYIYEQYFYVEF